MNIQSFFFFSKTKNTSKIIKFVFFLKISFKKKNLPPLPEAISQAARAPPSGKSPIFQPFTPGTAYVNSGDQPKEKLGGQFKMPQLLKKTPFSDIKLQKKRERGFYVCFRLFFIRENKFNLSIFSALIIGF